MERLVKKLKLKRFVATLLLVCTVMSTFFTSISSVNNITVSAADSNTRRMAMLQLANGASLSDVGCETNIDEGSLQTLAIYLSNFYIPFITVLDGDFQEEDSDDSGNKAHVQAMEDALEKNLGMNKQAAEFLVKYVLSESLSTCSEMLVKKDDLKSIWNYYLTKVYLDDNGCYSIGFFGPGAWSNPLVGAEVKHDSWNIYGGSNTSAFSYSLESDGFDKYCEYAGSYNVDGTDYVGITYPIFLQLMDLCYRISSKDTTSDGFTISDTYDISNRTNRNTDSVEPITGKSGDSYPDITKVPRMNFYYRDNSNHVHTVFSTSEECMQAYANVCDKLDYGNGWGSAVSWLCQEDIDAINNNNASIKGTALGAKLYVNWEGSIILDTGVYRTPILPGCANPHMLTTIADKGDANTVPLQNVFGIQRALDGHIKPHEYINQDGTVINSSANCMMAYVGPQSLFNLHLWRLQPGCSETKPDTSIAPWDGWGDNESLYNVIKSSKFARAAGTWKDVVVFPSWAHIGTSQTYQTFVTEDTKFLFINTGSEYIYGEDAVDNYSFLGTRPAYGSPVLMTDIIYFDDLTGFDNNSNLNDIFSVQDFSDDTFLAELTSNSLNTFANFQNITNLGHTATYSTDCQKLFRSLFFTYCFAYFNKDKHSYDAETCVIDLKMNVKNFPTYNMNVDWASLYADSLDDQIKSFVYYLLHPTEGISYVATLFKNKIGGFFLRWHDDIVGSTDSNSSTGMTKYLGTSSYTTTSGLYDVPWIATILEYYNSMIVYFIVIMVIILLCYVLTGSLSIQRSVFGLVLFALLAFLPPVAINTTVNISNTFSDKVYSDKFSYWAISQMETWLIGLDEALDARSKSDFDTYAAFVLNNQAQVSSGVGGEVETSYSGTKVKWMTPKRYSSLAVVSDKLNSIDTDASYLKTLMLGAVNSASSGETYIDSDNALYLYRDYTDIYRYGSTCYNIIETFNFDGRLIDKTSATASKYYNLIPYKTSSLDTITNAWESNNHNVNEISKELDFVPYLLANADYSSSDVGAESESSSIRAQNLGFLVNTIGLASSSSLNNEYYFYNVDGGNNNTLALTYLSLYNDNILRVHQKYKGLQQICDGTTVLNLGDDALNATGDAVNRNLATSMFNYGGKMHSSDSNADFRLGYNEIINAKDDGGALKDSNLFRQLSSMYYSLYSESPYYYFNNNIRDQVKTLTAYTYNYNDLANPKSNGDLSNVAGMLLEDNQSYFYNLSSNSGNGYGELRDFMNMHDFFYYIIPMLQDGVDLARLYDEQFGLYLDDDCSLSFNIENSSGYDIKFKYDGASYNSLKGFEDKWKTLNQEERYKFWHSYNTFTILLNYTAWLDTMMDCDYAKSETIRVLGDKYRVDNPLDPKSYFKTDDSGNIIEGRLMVFSRSEMAYYGLNEADLTEVERKIIKLQDTVYKEAINLMNYYTLSDETLIQAFAMMQTFEFNKEFSQTSYIKDDYVLYPQGYELKAFSYDAYLRMIVSEASGESLMSGGETADDGSVEANTSIYKRVLNNTSLFFALFLLLNDVFAVYLIPGLKLFFIVCIFFTSIALIIAAVVKLEMNMLKVMWHSLFAPLLGFSAISMGMSFIVSLFLGNGADGVASSSLVINLGDPTTAIIVMIIINVGATILYFKICKKCFHDFKTYIKAVFDNVSSTVVGAVGAVAGAVTAGKVVGKVKRALGTGNSNETDVPSTARQRGKDNSPTSGKNGLGNALASGAAGAGLGAATGLLSNSERQQAKLDNERKDASVGMNKYDKKAFDAANKKSDNALAKAERNEALANNATGLKKKRLELASNLQMKRAVRASTNADNISKYGRFGAMRKQIGTAASTAKQTASKGLGKAKATANSGMSRAQSLANTASINAKKASRFVKNGGVGRVVGSGAGHIANGASATATFIRQSPQNIKKGARAVGTSIGNGAKQAASYTARTVREAPVAVKKAGMSALNAGREAGRTVARATVNTGKRVATETANIARTNVYEGKNSYKNTRK